MKTGRGLLLQRLGILIISAVISMCASTALAAIPQPDLLEIKAKLEDSIAKKYRDRISTRLQPSLFTVGAQINIEVQKDKETDGSVGMNNPEIPNDITLGILTSMQIPGVHSLARENIKITRVLLHVGLSPKLGEQYREQFRTWLNTNIRSEFGNMGSSTINDFVEGPKETENQPKVFELKMEPKAIEITMPEPTKPRVLTWEERFGNFQNLIGLAIFALLVAITYVIGKFIPSRDAKEQAAVALKIQEMQASAGPIEATATKALTPDGISKVSGSTDASEQLRFDNFQQHQRKVAFLALSSQQNMEQATRLWMDQGEVGRGKLALVLDCILALMGGMKFVENNSGVKDLDWGIPDDYKYDKALSQVFRSVPSMEIEAKYSLLESAYWDLLSIRTLGEPMVRQRFANLGYLPVDSLQKVLSKQNSKVKSLALLHLPQDKQSALMATMPFEEKKALLDQAFASNKISDADLDNIDNSLNTLLRREVKGKAGSLDLPTLVPGFLSSLKPIEELKLIRDLVNDKPEFSSFLKENYPTISFLAEWPQDKVKLLLSRFKSNQILALLQLMPELKDTVLDSVPPRTKAMIEEDLGVKMFTEDEMNQHLNEIRTRLFQMYENGEVSLRVIFEKSIAEDRGAAA